MKPAAIALAVALTACSHVTGAPPPSFPSPLLGAPMPPFRRAALDGSLVDTAQASGRPLVVKFFARYCVPCQRTLPSAQALHAEDPSTLFVGISEDETEAEAEEQVARYQLTFPVVLDREHVLAGKFRANELPVVFVADGTGRVAWVGGPGQSEGDLRAALQSLSAR